MRLIQNTRTRLRSVTTVAKAFNLTKLRLEAGNVQTRSSNGVLRFVNHPANIDGNDESHHYNHTRRFCHRVLHGVCSHVKLKLKHQLLKHTYDCIVKTCQLFTTLWCYNIACRCKSHGVYNMMLGGRNLFASDNPLISLYATSRSILMRLYYSLTLLPVVLNDLRSC
jgi:hypothetical protein